MSAFDLAATIKADNDAMVKRIGAGNVDWPRVNAVEASFRAVGLRPALAGELALALVLRGETTEIFITVADKAA